MGECAGFQAQIAAVIELLANSAVAEICKLVDDGYAVLRAQMDLERQKSEKENRVLRQKLREMDVKIRSYERKVKRRSLREELLHGAASRPPAGKRAVLPPDQQPHTHTHIQPVMVYSQKCLGAQPPGALSESSLS